MTRWRVRVATLTAAFLMISALPFGAIAANPASGTVSPASPTIDWTGPPVTAMTDGPSDAECAAPPDPLPGFCDDFFLTVGVNATYWNTHSGGVFVDVTGLPPAEDFDLYVYDKNGQEVATSGLPGSVESALVECPSSDLSPYKVRVVYFATIDEGSGLPGYQGHAEFSSQDGACAGEAEGGPATFQRDALSFAPATIASAHFLGAEPQVTIERREAYTPGSAGISPNRIFVDWPLSSRSGIGQLTRSLDGGDSFRLLLDLTCASRSRPNCLTGGGGDTENDVNLRSGNVYFADQEVLANEALAASFDHGDSWLVQTAVSNGTAGTDRQWIGTTDNTVTLPVTNRAIEGFLVYHVPPNQYIQAIDATGAPIPQPVPQLNNVGQSGQVRVDNNASSPGHGWIYQPHVGVTPGGTFVATAASAGYALPTNWQDNPVSASSATSFPWVAIDHAGNAYATWDSGGVVWYSFSPISDKANDPAFGGRPGTLWSPRVRVSLPEVGSAVFPEVTAGDEGRIGITYVGTTDFTGQPDDAPDTATWQTYAAVLPDALSLQPTVATGLVTHRIMHVGNICTSGTTCLTTGKDRSLLDMIDISYDEDGRLGIITMDNNSNGFHALATEDEGPFAHFTKQTSGISVLADKTINVPIPTGSRSDPAGDATWPNRAGGTYLSALDALNASLVLEGGQLTARIKLPAGTTTSQMANAMTAYNATVCAPVTSCLADRLQYVLRFMTGDEIYHLSAEFVAPNTLRFFGGRLDGNDKLSSATNPTAIFGAGYHTDFTANGSLTNGELVIRAPTSRFGLSVGSKVYSVSAFAMAGPREADEILIERIMRTVDATPPFDAALVDVTKADLSVIKTDSPDPAKAGGTLTYTIVVTNNGPAAATGVTMTDQLPKNAGYGSVTTTRGTCTAKPAKRLVTCNLGNMASGTSATIVITVKPTNPGTLTNTATVAATSPQDSNTTNNTAVATTTVTP